MKYVVFLIFYFPIVLLAQQDDSFWISFFKHNPGSAVSVIALSFFWFIIKPIYNSFKNKVKVGLTDTDKMSECKVLETPFYVFENCSVDSKVITEFKIGDKFFIDFDFTDNDYYKVYLTTGFLGYINNTCKFEQIFNK